jgi:YfiH family protein
MIMSSEPIQWVEAGWPHGGRLRALTTTRVGGFSLAPWGGFNLADHVGDDPAHVAANRDLLRRHLGAMPVQWLEQVHGVRVVEAGLEALPEADAVWTSRPGQVLAVLTADCLPVVLADLAGQAIAAAHGGWRGLVDGILAETVQAMPVQPEIAWLGPAIGSDVYEVGQEVLEQVVENNVKFERALRRGPEPGKGYLDLATLAALQLAELGVQKVFRSGLSTWDTNRFYSYRREGQTGRMATLAWLSP